MQIRQSGIASSANIADGSITNAKVSASAAIDYSKLNLATSVALTDLTAALELHLLSMGLLYE